MSREKEPLLVQNKTTSKSMTATPIIPLIICDFCFQNQVFHFYWFMQSRTLNVW